MMLILAYRGSEEKSALKRQVEKARDEAKAEGMAVPLIVWHDEQIILDV